MKTRPLPRPLGALLPLALLLALPLTCSVARAQSTVFTYQGRITSNGTNFNGAGQFKFALVTSTNHNHQATATANMGGIAPNEFVSSCSVLFGGNGYLSAPAVSFSGGGGSGASAQANLSGGSVSSVTVLTPGSAYSSPPTVTIAPPPPNVTYVTYWSNDGTSVAGSQPGASVTVNVANGLFTVVLGDTTLANMAAIDASLFAQPNLQLRIWFNDGVHGFAALDPAQSLTPAPYAIGVQGPVPAAQLIGTLPAGQLGGTYSGLVTFNNSSNTFSGSYSGNGGGVTNLSPAALALFATNTSVTSWGWNQYGQRSVPTNAQNAVAIAAGEVHSLAVRADGTVVAWGGGQTNNPSDGYDFGQAIVPTGLGSVVAVSAGAVHSLALRTDGTVIAWGAGLTNDGSYGLNFGQSQVPAGLGNVVAISGGAVHSLALKADGTVVAWGAGQTNSGSNYQFGQSLIPPGVNNIKAIAAGYLCSTVLRSNGTVLTWGDNTYGETNMPPGLSNVVAIAGGGVHTLALKSDGTVVAWGSGLSNNPTDGINFGQSMVPPGLSNVIAISAGLFNSIALKSDGTVVAWGNNTYGQSSAPSGLNNVLAIASGSVAYHVLAIRKQSDAPVAWLNSDNTFNGNITVNGDTTISGELMASDLRLNDGTLWLRGGNDQKNGLGWYLSGTKQFSGSFYSGQPDGPVLFGEGGGVLGSYGTNGQQVALVWDAAQHVGLGTVFPTARLDLGPDYADTKLNIGAGFGLGVTNSQLEFHLSGGSGAFSFRDAAGGTELVNLRTFGGVGNARLNVSGSVQVSGQIQLGSSGQYTVPAANEALRIVRGQVRYDGFILTGAGFSVSHTVTGQFAVTFNPAFSGIPVVVATPQHGIAQMATVSSPSASTVTVDTWDANGAASDQYFQFIAIGPP